MSNRERFIEHLRRAKQEHAAIPGLWIDSFLEAEALIEIDRGTGREVKLFMVSSERRNLGVFVKSLRCFEGKEVFVQVVGDDPEKLAVMASELDIDAVYLKTSMPEAAKVLCNRVDRSRVVTEILLPWKRAEPNQPSEGRIVDEEKARMILRQDGLDIAAVPVGGGPGPYKSWRIPLWSTEMFFRVMEWNPDLFYALPWGSLLPKDLIRKYNLYGGALPGVVSLPKQQFRTFVSSGAVKVSFRSDLALAFLSGLRESLYRRPEQIDLPKHLSCAQEGLVQFMGERFKELR